MDSDTLHKMLAEVEDRNRQNAEHQVTLAVGYIIATYMFPKNDHAYFDIDGITQFAQRFDVEKTFDPVTKRWCVKIKLKELTSNG